MHLQMTDSPSRFCLRGENRTQINSIFDWHLLLLPVSINEAGVDVIGSFQPSDWLQTDACGLVGHDVDQPILELVAGEVGADEA